MRIALVITCYNSVRFLGSQFHYLSLLNPKPDMIYFVENNSMDGTPDWIRSHAPRLNIPWKLITYKLRNDAVKYFVDHNGTAYDVIAIARQIGLNALRRDGCDYGIFIDDDLYMTESDALAKITQWEGYDIIGGTYQRIYPEGMYVASKWGTTMLHKYKLRKLQEVSKPCDFPSITSGGCMCLSKRLIQDTSVKFYPVIEGNMVGASEDYGYCIKATNRGYTIILDNSTKLHHMAIETIKDIKPWTVIDGKYASFEYGKAYGKKKK